MTGFSEEGPHKASHALDAQARVLTQWHFQSVRNAEVVERCGDDVRCKGDPPNSSNVCCPQPGSLGTWTAAARASRDRMSFRNRVPTVSWPSLDNVYWNIPCVRFCDRQASKAMHTLAANKRGANGRRLLAFG